MGDVGHKDERFIEDGKISASNWASDFSLVLVLTAKKPLFAQLDSSETITSCFDYLQPKLKVFVPNAALLFQETLWSLTRFSQFFPVRSVPSAEMSLN